jgi:hypothetical protein
VLQQTSTIVSPIGNNYYRLRTIRQNTLIMRIPKTFFNQMAENRLENTVVQYAENYKILQYNEELWHNTTPKMFLRVKIVTLL